MKPGTAMGDPLEGDFPPGVHRFSSRSATATILPALARAGWATAVVDLEGATEKAAIIETFACGLSFPGWVGRNWDALDDALRDLSWWPSGARGRLIVVRGADRASTGTPRDRETVRDLLETAAARWSSTGSPLVVLLRR